MDGPLTDDEQRQLAELLRRACEHHLDQFVGLKIRTRHGPHYVLITNGPPPGTPDDDDFYEWYPDYLLYEQPRNLDDE